MRKSWEASWVSEEDEEGRIVTSPTVMQQQQQQYTLPWKRSPASKYSDVSV